MRRRRGGPAGPLPQRDGIDAVRLRLPADGGWPTAAAYLAERYGRVIGAERLTAMLREGVFVTADGPLTALTPYEPGGSVWFHRDLAPETPVPFPVTVLHRDERIVVADKPHFLATTPRGRHVTETALARLRRELDLPGLGPAHRLDRLTAGVVLFVVRPELRGAYQSLFERREVRKEYEAVAAHAPGLPAVRRSRIVKVRGELAAYEEPGSPTARPGSSRSGAAEVSPATGCPRTPAARTSCACTCRRWACRSSVTRSIRRCCPTRPRTTSAGRCNCSPRCWSSPTR